MGAHNCFPTTMTLEPLLFRHPVILAGGDSSRQLERRAACRSIRLGRDPEKIQQRSDLQIVHFRSVDNLAPDLFRPRAHRLRTRPVEEQFFVRPGPSPELFLERGKSILCDQDQGACDA